MESFRKFMFAALTAASLVTFAGCDPVEPIDDGGRGNGTALVDGKITGQIADAADIIQIKAFDYKEEWTMATAPVQNGSFTLALPETVESSRLSSFKNFPSTITVSDANVKQTHINLAESENLKAYSSDGELLGYIECYSADKKNGIESFMYVDRDCKISGSVFSDSNDDGIGDRTITYNIDLKKGWNISYYKINDNGVEFTTAKPDAELKWVVKWLKQTDLEEPETEIKLISRIEFYTYYAYVGGEGQEPPANFSDIDTVSYELQYDEQRRISAIIYKRSDYEGNILSTISITYPDANSIHLTAGSEVNQTNPLNSDGSVISMGNRNFTYTNGFLQKFEEPTTVTVGTVYDEEKNIIEAGVKHAGVYSKIYTWENGNIKKITDKAAFSTAPSENWVAHNILDYEYGTTLHKPCSIDLGTCFEEGGDGLTPRGWLGKTTTHLPSKITRTDASVAYPFIYETRYRYETDSKGYVQKIYEDGNGHEERIFCKISYR